MTAIATEPIQRLRIRRSAWLAVIASLLSVFVLFKLIDGCRAYLMHSITLEYFERLLKTSSTDLVEKALTYIGTLRKEEEIFDLFPEADSVTEQREELLRATLALRGALIAENRAEIRIATGEINRAFLQRHAFHGRSSGQLVNIQRLLTENLREHQKIISEIAKIGSDRKSVDEELLLLQTRYDLIEGDLSELFSLNLKAAPHRGEIAFYTSGVLAGLPTIATIRDNLKDLVELRDELVRAGGKVRIEGDNAHALFSEQLEQIKAQSSEIYQQFKTLDQQREKSLERLQELKSDRRSRREHLISTINHLIITLVSS